MDKTIASFALEHPFVVVNVKVTFPFNMSDALGVYIACNVLASGKNVPLVGDVHKRLV